MRVAGVRKVRRSKRLFTTKADPRQALPHDLVRRRLTEGGLRKLWVADVTYVAIWLGFAYVAFVTDVYSRSSRRTTLTSNQPSRRPPDQAQTRN